MNHNKRSDASKFVYFFPNILKYFIVHFFLSVNEMSAPVGCRLCHVHACIGLARFLFIFFCLCSHILSHLIRLPLAAFWCIRAYRCTQLVSPQNKPDKRECVCDSCVNRRVISRACVLFLCSHSQIFVPFFAQAFSMWTQSVAIPFCYDAHIVK